MIQTMNNVNPNCGLIPMEYINSDDFLKTKYELNDSDDFWWLSAKNIGIKWYEFDCLKMFKCNEIENWNDFQNEYIKHAKIRLKKLDLENDFN